MVDMLACGDDVGVGGRADGDVVLRIDWVNDRWLLLLPTQSGVGVTLLLLPLPCSRLCLFAYHLQLGLLLRRRRLAMLPLLLLLSLLSLHRSDVLGLRDPLGLQTAAGKFACALVVASLLGGSSGFEASF